MLFEKERERASLANDLDVAAQLGLVVSETNEALQLKVIQERAISRHLPTDTSSSQPVASIFRTRK